MEHESDPERNGTRECQPCVLKLIVDDEAQILSTGLCRFGTKLLSYLWVQRRSMQKNV